MVLDGIRLFSGSFLLSTGGLELQGTHGLEAVQHGWECRGLAKGMVNLLGAPAEKDAAICRGTLCSQVKPDVIGELSPGRVPHCLDAPSLSQCALSTCYMLGISCVE